jgi:hypothetical protein
MGALPNVSDCERLLRFLPPRKRQEAEAILRAQWQAQRGQLSDLALDRDQPLDQG